MVLILLSQYLHDKYTKLSKTALIKTLHSILLFVPLSKNIPANTSFYSKKIHFEEDQLFTDQIILKLL